MGNFLHIDALKNLPDILITHWQRLVKRDTKSIINDPCDLRPTCGHPEWLKLTYWKTNEDSREEAEEGGSESILLCYRRSSQFQQSGTGRQTTYLFSCLTFQLT